LWVTENSSVAARSQGLRGEAWRFAEYGLGVLGFELARVVPLKSHVFARYSDRICLYPMRSLQ